MRFVHHHDDIISFIKHRMDFQCSFLKFMNQRKDESMVFIKQFSQLVYIFCPYVFFGIDAGIRESFINLFIQFLSVRDHDEGEISFEFSEDFIGKESHAITFAAPLRMSEHSEFSIQIFSVFDILEGLIDSQELVILRHDFYYFSFFFFIHDKVF